MKMCWSAGSARVNGLQLRWEQAGPQHGEPLLLVMGLGGQLIHWPDALCESLVQQGFRVTRYDHRDAGLSDDADRCLPVDHTGLTVDGKELNEPYLDPDTMMADPAVYPCLGNEFGPVTVPEDRIWVMGDNRTHSADSRSHCSNRPEDAQNGLLCTGDPVAGTIPVENVIGKARFIAWPPSRWGGVNTTDPQS